LTREYPAQPFVGVGAVVICDGKLLLAKRSSDPGKNQWTIPGGLVNLGETVSAAVVREVKEESNLDVEVDSLIDVVDVMEPDEAAKFRFHFVILDFFTRLKGGTLQGGSDVREVRWVPLNEVESYDLTKSFRAFFERNRGALQRCTSC
jgi:ADP-ribose pyrophosphatase YjhB (NUDIX family)